MRCSYRIFFVVLIAVELIASFACSESSNYRELGGETHWLSVCTDDTTCSDGMDCLCGICTMACENDDQCSQFDAKVACTEASATPFFADCTTKAARELALCALPCESNADCDLDDAKLECTQRQCVDDDHTAVPTNIKRDSGGSGVADASVVSPEIQPFAVDITVEGESAALEFPEDAPFYYKTCTDAFQVYKQDAGRWVSLLDERPWGSNGAHFIEGEFEPYVFAGEGCDVVGCVEISDQTVSLLEYKETGTKAPPPDAAVAGLLPNEIPVIETNIAAAPWKIDIEYYTEPDCSGIFHSQTTVIDE